MTSKTLEAWFDFKTFYIPEGKSYVETHLNFTGRSLDYQTISDSSKQATVQVTILVSHAGEIVDYKKMNVNGPILQHHEFLDFLDIQRFELENGEYKFEIELLDINHAENKPLKLEQEFIINALSEGIFISDIELVKAYNRADENSDLSKSGYNLLPFVSNHFPSDYNSLIFYAEAYNANKYFGEGEKYAMVYSIQDPKSGNVVSDLQFIKRMDANAVNPVLQTFNITELKTGDYNLVVEMRNKLNEPEAIKRLRITRNKAVNINDVDDLASISTSNLFTTRYTDYPLLQDYIKSLYPIAGTLEKRSINKYTDLEDVELLQKFLYHFWYIRNRENPELAWNNYQIEVLKANSNYGTRVKKGYETDRGRVYLMYGPPNSIASRLDDLGTVPYEIWHYYKLKNFSNKRFLFWNPDLVTNDFELLHSDVPGEVVNSNWFGAILTGDKGNITNDNGMEEVNRPLEDQWGAGETLKDLYFNPR